MRWTGSDLSEGGQVQGEEMEGNLGGRPEGGDLGREREVSNGLEGRVQLSQASTACQAFMYSPSPKPHAFRGCCHQHYYVIMPILQMRKSRPRQVK